MFKYWLKQYQPQQQPQQIQQQKQEEKQQRLHHHHHQYRQPVHHQSMEQVKQNLCLNFNVHINVNVNTKTNKTSTNTNNNNNGKCTLPIAKLINSIPTKPLPIQTTKRKPLTSICLPHNKSNSIHSHNNKQPYQYHQKEHLDEHYQTTRTISHQNHKFNFEFNGNNGNNGISMVLIVNLLFLIFLSVCCDVCKSQNETDKVSAERNFAEHINKNLTVLFSNESGDSDDAVIVDHITDNCKQRCTDECSLCQDEFGIKCERTSQDEKCFHNRCIKGCLNWWQAFQEFESCQEACSSTRFVPFDLACISSCETSQRYYWHFQRMAYEDYVQTYPPVLTADSLTSHSMSLRWPVSIPEHLLANRPFLIQYQIAANANNESETAMEEATSQESSSSKWLYLTNYNCNDMFECDLLDSLMPYTNYRFRFELPIGENVEDYLYSPPSKVYTTLSDGEPLSEVIIEKLFGVDHKHIFVSWKPGPYTNGPLKGFKVLVKNPQNAVVFEKILPGNGTKQFIGFLNPATNYTVSLAMINEAGQGPVVEASVMTKSSPQFSGDLEQIHVLYAGDFSIRSKSLEPLAESVLIFETENLICDYDIDMMTQRLFIVDDEGEISSLILGQQDGQYSFNLESSYPEMKPFKISVDFLGQRLFIAGKLSGGEFWSLVSTDYAGGSLQVLSTTLAEQIDSIQMDSMNGWLFLLSVTNSIFMKMNLATKLLSKIDTPNIHVGSFTNDYGRLMLLVQNKHDNELYEVSYDGVYREKLSMSNGSLVSMESLAKRLLPGHWHSVAHFADIVLATNGTHLMHYNYETNENEIVLLKEVDWCWKILPVQQLNYQQKLQQTAVSIRPLPKPNGPPSDLQVLLTATMAKISWSPPVLYLEEHLQTMSAWQEWEYELEILDVASNSAFQIRNIRSTFFNVEKLQAQSVYKIRVKASSRYGFFETQWSDEVLTRTWPLGQHKFIWISSTGNVYESDELGGNINILNKLSSNIADFLQINGTLLYLTEEGHHLKCENLRNPEVTCSLKADNVRDFAYDWRGGKVYWIDFFRNCIIRSDLSGNDLELLPTFGAYSLEIDSLNGYLYYTTATRLLRRPLSGSQGVEESIYYHANGLNEKISSFTLDLKQQDIYCLVLDHEGAANLFKISLQFHSPASTSSKPFRNDIQAKSLQYISEVNRLLWLSEDGKRAGFATWSELEHVDWLDLNKDEERFNAIHMMKDYTPYPDDMVLPEEISAASVYIDVGYWDDFNVRWDPVSNVENFSIYYSVVYSHDSNVRAVEVIEPLINLNDLKKAQTKLDISITAHTYWRTGPTTRVQLITPAAAPTQPKRLRVYLQREDLPLEEKSRYSTLLRWDPPEKVVGLTGGNGVLGYKVFSWLGSEHFEEKEVESKGPLEVIFQNLTFGATYTFQVQTMTTGRFATAGEKSAVHALQVGSGSPVRPFVIYSTAEYIASYDLDLGKSSIMVYTSSEVDHLEVIQGEQRLVWVNDNVELMSFAPGSASPIKLARMRAEVLALTVDWISRMVYWAEMNTSRDEVDIYNLDLCDFEGKVMQGSKLFSLPRYRTLKDLLVLPFSRVLIWLEQVKGEKFSRLNARRLKDLRPLKLKKDNWHRMFEAAFTEELETLSLVDMKGRSCVFDLQRQLCVPQKMHFGVGNDPQTEVSRDPGYFYVLRNETLKAYSRKKHTVEYMKHLPGAKRVKAYNTQEYPKKECLLSERENGEDLRQILQPDIEELEENFITIEMPNLNEKNPECSLPMPGTEYTMNLTDSRNVSRILKTHEPLFNWTDLEPFTNYYFQFNISSYYQQKMERPIWVSKVFEFRTAESTPDLPEDFKAIALSPHDILVTWKPSPIKNYNEIHFELHWQILNASHSAKKLINDTELGLTNLEADSTYEMFLRVFSLPHKSQNTEPITVTTFKKPNPLHILDMSPYNLTLGWKPNAEFHSVILSCQAVNDVDSFSLDMTSNQTYIVVSGLEPKTRYRFHLELQYAAKAPAFQWPEFPKDHFVFETLGDHPGSPGKPEIELITGQIFKVFWEPAESHGSPIIEYNMEALQARKRYRRNVHQASLGALALGGDAFNNSDTLLSTLPWLEEPLPLEDKWISYCNTSELSCIVRDLHTRHLLMFRVRARNEPYGWGPYSQESDYVAEPFVTPEKRNTLIWAIIAPAAIVSTCVIIIFILKQLQNRRIRAKKRFLEKARPSIWSTISSNQQQHLMLTRNRGLSIVSNSTSFGGGVGGVSAICGFGPLSDADIALLPQIKWSQISLLNFLGSGAFGEVYEGLVHYDDERSPEKVAIKSLRKGCTEFSELLQEAQLMSMFNHENIVRLIGICLDSESISIIMEHMEGGDLLTYLRESRASPNRPLASLQLLDLISMCIDVATGCSYLEDMHFVHRDLACRNCLVSSKNPVKRAVKIGDFGLARDIYKHDYYRKEGEGLLPVRWMSPESLTDGIFTTQSDVWAFGVLCWEILTLGQQPYAARTNTEVLHFVKAGGHLEQPDNCPDKLFTLMKECWRADPEGRPSFRKCVNTLISIKIDVRRVNLGYNMDDGDSGMYANSNGILLSNFLATPLPKVDEDSEDGTSNISSSNVWSQLEVRKSYDFKEVQDDSSQGEGEDVYCDPSTVIPRKLTGDSVGDSEHEGVSRL